MIYRIEADKTALDNVRTKLIGEKQCLWFHRETWLEKTWCLHKQEVLSNLSEDVRENTGEKSHRIH